MGEKGGVGRREKVWVGGEELTVVDGCLHWRASQFPRLLISRRSLANPLLPTTPVTARAAVTHTHWHTGLIITVAHVLQVLRHQHHDTRKRRSKSNEAW